MASLKIWSVSLLLLLSLSLSVGNRILLDHDHKTDQDPHTYGELFHQLVQYHLASPIHLNPIKPPYPKWYDAGAKCEYHSGAPGHTIENCPDFKRKVQTLIETGCLKFDSHNRILLDHDNTCQGHHDPQTTSHWGEGRTTHADEDAEEPWLIFGKKPVFVGGKFSYPNQNMGDIRQPDSGDGDGVGVGFGFPAAGGGAGMGGGEVSGGGSWNEGGDGGGGWSGGGVEGVGCSACPSQKHNEEQHKH